MQQFKIYWSLNKDHLIIATPYFHAIYFLSQIKGPLVNDWKNNQVENLRNKTTRAQNQIAWTEPALWNELKVAFTTVFTDNAKVQNTYFKLMNYYQHNDSIDTYISTFRHLAKAAGYLPDAAATIDIFLKHLDWRLLVKILDWETEPVNMARWKEAAWVEYKRAHKKVVMLWPQKYEWNPPPPQWNGRGRNWYPDEDPWPYVPMDVDEPTFTHVSRTYTEEDKVHYWKEGWCFCYDKQEHIQWVKKLSQCLAVSERVVCNKSNKLENNLKIIHVIV